MSSELPIQPPQSMALMDAARQVLRESGQPMHANDIWSEIERRGLFASAGKTPLQTMATSLLRATLGVNISKSRSTKSFYKAGANTFGLVEWLDPTRRAELEEEEAALAAADAAIEDEDGPQDQVERSPASVDLPDPSEPALKRVWVIPILRALRELGGSAAPKVVEQTIRDLYRDQLTDGQFARAVKNNHIRFTRLGLSKLGLMGGAYGRWDLTESGAAYLATHGQGAVDFSGVSGLAEHENQNLDEVETVKTTGMAAYAVPVLKILQDGINEKQPIMDAVATRYRDELLPGDLRIQSNGLMVFPQRASSMLTRLKNAGLARNSARGVWEITEAGRRQLQEQADSWDIKRFQDSSAQVWREGAKLEPIESPAPRPALASWNDLGRRFPSIHEQLHRRLRPDLGPTPTLDRPIARNAILYGPPGTGKTFVAKLVAQALTGDAEPGPESAWRIVQFHPSYAYEDFVQGLRPDLQQGGGRFKLIEGPFMQICEEAEEDPDRFHVLVIDEINRGDPARIFGELLYSIEYRGEPVDLAMGGQLTVPPNLVLIGTMNSVDRSVALVDYALRRRFSFVRVDPAPEVLEDVRSREAGAAMAASVLEVFNRWLAAELDRDHVIGHSFFLHPGLALHGPGALAAVWADSIQPLLEEYFYGDAARMKAAAKAWQRAVDEAAAEDPEEST